MLTYEECIGKMNAIIAMAQVKKTEGAETDEELKDLFTKHTNLSTRLEAIDNILQEPLDEQSIRRRQQESNLTGRGFREQIHKMIAEKHQIERKLSQIEERISEIAREKADEKTKIERKEPVSAEPLLSRYKRRGIEEYFQTNREALLEEIGDVLDSIIGSNDLKELLSSKDLVHEQDAEDRFSYLPENDQFVFTVANDKKLLREKTRSILANNKAIRQQIINECVPRNAGPDFVAVFEDMFLPSPERTMQAEKYATTINNVVSDFSVKLEKFIMDSLPPAIDAPAELKKKEFVKDKMRIHANAQLTRLIRRFLFENTNGFKEPLHALPKMREYLAKKIQQIFVLNNMNDVGEDIKTTWQFSDLTTVNSLTHYGQDGTVTNYGSKQARIVCFINDFKFYIRFYIGSKLIYSVFVPISRDNNEIGQPQSFVPTQESERNARYRIMTYIAARTMMEELFTQDPVRYGDLTITKLLKNIKAKGILIDKLVLRFQKNFPEEQNITAGEARKIFEKQINIILGNRKDDIDLETVEEKERKEQKEKERKEKEEQEKQKKQKATVPVVDLSAPMQSKPSDVIDEPPTAEEDILPTDEDEEVPTATSLPVDDDEKGSAGIKSAFTKHLWMLRGMNKKNA